MAQWSWSDLHHLKAQSLACCSSLLFKNVVVVAFLQHSQHILHFTDSSTTRLLWSPGDSWWRRAAPLILWWFLAWLLLCSYVIKQSKCESWGVCTIVFTSLVRKIDCATLVPAASHPWGSPISKVIQCGSALTLMGILWLLCLEHRISMVGNQTNSASCLIGASCGDGGNAVCCIPVSLSHSNLLASSTCCRWWGFRS